MTDAVILSSAYKRRAARRELPRLRSLVSRFMVRP